MTLFFYSYTLRYTNILDYMAASAHAGRGVVNVTFMYGRYTILVELLPRNYLVQVYFCEPFWEIRRGSEFGQKIELN
jgi:hypothetical protein